MSVICPVFPFLSGVYSDFVTNHYPLDQFASARKVIFCQHSLLENSWCPSNMITWTQGVGQSNTVIDCKLDSGSIKINSTQFFFNCERK